MKRVYSVKMTMMDKRSAAFLDQITVTKNVVADSVTEAVERATSIYYAHSLARGLMPETPICGNVILFVGRRIE